jgi:hypothetical protein
MRFLRAGAAPEGGNAIEAQMDAFVVRVPQPIAPVAPAPDGRMCATRMASSGRGDLFRSQRLLK